MEQTLRQFASIFDYYSNTLTSVEKQASSYYNIWTEIDQNIKRLYSIGQIIEVPEKELVYQDFKNNFENFCNKSLDEVIIISSDPDFLGFKSSSKIDIIKNSDIRDSTQIQFFKLYSHIIVNLKHLGYIDTNRNFDHIFFVLENFNKINELLLTKNNDNSALQLYCNYLYGRLPKSDGKKVQIVAQCIANKIQQIKECFYADVDIFFLKNSNFTNNIDDFLKILGLPYEKELIDHVVIFSQKKYFLKSANGSVRIRGFPELTPNQLESLGIK